MQIKHFFDLETSTYSYILRDSNTNKCAIIDPVLNYNQFSGSVSYQLADQLISYINENELNLEWILETHPHADHLTSAQYLKQKLGGKIAIGENIIEVLKFWAPMFGGDFKIDGGDFDKLLKNEEIIQLGSLNIKIMHTRGHTPACVCYAVEDVIFVGDVIFQPYVGTARTDFPGGSAKDLFNSIQKIFSLSGETKIYVGHDYPSNGEPKPCVLVKEQKERNIMITASTTEEEFILKRNNKDVGKAVPKLILPAIQFNLRAGAFENNRDNGINYIKIPINCLN